MRTHAIVLAIGVALPLTTASLFAQPRDQQKSPAQVSSNVKQHTEAGHNFNNVIGDINIVGISPKQYRDDLNALEQELTQRHAKLVQEQKAAYAKDRQRAQSLEQQKTVAEKELQDLREKMADVQNSYQQQVQYLQQQIDALSDQSYLFSAEVLREAQIALANGDDSKAKAIYTKITHLAKVMDQQAAQAEYQLGTMAEQKIDYYAAYQHYREAAKRDEQNPEYLSKAGDLADIVALYDTSISYFEKALAIQLKTKQETAPEVAVLWNNLGGAWSAKGQHDKALEYFEKALASDLKTYGPEHPNVATYWNNLGVAWHSKGQYDKAIENYEKALASDLKTYGAEHPDVAVRWNNLGEAWRAKGQYDKAIGYYEKALESGLKTYGPEHPAVAVRWNNLGAAWRAKGQYDKAIEYYEKALASDLKTYGQEHPDVARNWNNLGLAWYSKGQYDKAIEYYEKALIVMRKFLGDEHPSTGLTKNNLEYAKQQLTESK